MDLPSLVAAEDAGLVNSGAANRTDQQSQNSLLGGLAVGYA